ncbi:hypothetical protein MCAG_03818 [Micromonospora sp. ATCC 39149]|nr:hypothetical protein MCAG_03818 [Micromonospora sp. ATCC 39149]
MLHHATSVCHTRWHRERHHPEGAEMTATEIRTAARQMVLQGHAPNLATAHARIVAAEATAAADAWRAGLPAEDR